MRMSLLVTILLLLVTTVVAAPKLAPANLALYCYQRTFLTNNPQTFSLNSYNVPSVKFRVYRVPVQKIVPDATTIAIGENAKNPKSISSRLKTMTLTHPAAQWAVGKEPLS